MREVGPQYNAAVQREESCVGDELSWLHLPQAFGPLLGMDMKYNYAAEKELESGLDCVISENS